MQDLIDLIHGIFVEPYSPFPADRFLGLWKDSQGQRKDKEEGQKISHITSGPFCIPSFHAVPDEFRDKAGYIEKRKCRGSFLGLYTFKG